MRVVSRPVARPFLHSIAGLCLFALSSPLTLGASGCARHVRMAMPQTEPGPRYVCRGAGKCTPANTDVPSELNPSGTTYVTLPEQCKGRVHQIVVLDADSSEPKVDVTCAAPDDPIEEM